jgi:hypothetical protein
MPQATNDHTPTTVDPYAGWSLGGLEPAILNLRATVGILHHLAHSPSQVELDEWGKVEDDLNAAAAEIKELWRAAWDQRIREDRAHEAALAAAEAKKAAPGSPEDVRSAEFMWAMLRSAAEVVAMHCADAGHPLIGWRRDEE